jgi:hypothetical protein
MVPSKHPPPTFSALREKEQGSLRVNPDGRMSAAPGRLEA